MVIDQPKATNEYPLIGILRSKITFDLSALAFMVAGKTINSKLAEFFANNPWFWDSLFNSPNSWKNVMVT